MFKFNIFSGNTYLESKNFKVSSTGETFVKAGSFWLGDNNKTILETQHQQINLDTGVMSNFGDPFGDKNGY